MEALTPRKQVSFFGVGFPV